MDQSIRDESRIRAPATFADNRLVTCEKVRQKSSGASVGGWYCLSPDTTVFLSCRDEFTIRSERSVGFRRTFSPVLIFLWYFLFIKEKKVRIADTRLYFWNGSTLADQSSESY